MQVAKRFWKDVSVKPEGDMFSIWLDTRQMKTPLKATLAVPTRAYAEGIAAEWDAVEGEIKPLTMHLTRAANATIDYVIAKRAEVAEMLAEYASTDLICYRAEGPEALVDRQADAWDPLLKWAVKLGAPLTPTQGVIPIAQPENSLKTLRSLVQEIDAWRLTAFHDLVTISGSLIIGFAVFRGKLTAEDAWQLSRIDESWQEEQWGEDAEATATAIHKRDEFLKAAHLLSLLDGV